MSSERPEHDTVIPRRRRSPAVVTSVAAAVLLAGGGGAYWASTASSSSIGGAGSGGAADNGGGPPPLALDGTGQSGGTAGIAPGEPDPHGTVYRAAGPLPDGPDKAPVYRTEGTVTAAEVAKLADALGVAGTPRLDGTSWKVGSDHDTSGPLLRVAQQAPGTWTFARFGTGGSDNCPKIKSCTSGIAPGGEGPAVSEQAAKAAAAPVLKTLGQDDAKLNADQVLGSVRVVNADPKIGGLPTHGWTTGLRIASDGKLVGGSGEVKAPVKGAEYPLISAGEALKQLNAPAEGASRAGTGGCATTEPLTPKTKPGEAKSDGLRCVPASKAPKPQPTTISHATLGLAVQLTGGRQTLVPSWLFELKPTDNTRPATVTWTAVDPKYLVHPTPSGGRNHPGATDNRKLQSFSSTGRKLTVHFWGGVCGTYEAKASEDSGAVRVSLDGPSKKPGKVCITLAKDLTRTVTLDKPLGSRHVVDAASGETVPQK